MRFIFNTKPKVKNNLLLIFIISLITTQIFSQTTISGYVIDKDNKGMFDVTVSLLPDNINVQTDRSGYFQFKNVEAGVYTIAINKEAYLPYNTEIIVGSENVDVGEIKLEYNPEGVNIGIITLTDDELDSDESQNQSGIGLLQASRDVFSRIAAFEWGGYWFRTRGLDNRYRDIMFNGIRMNQVTDGSVNWGHWGGLNDVTRYPDELIENASPSDNGFGGLASTTNFNTWAHNYRERTSLAYSFTNRSYDHRLMLTHSSALNKNGWAYTVSASKRWAEEGVIEGTLYDAYSFFASVEKKLGDNHSLNLTAFGAPTRRTTNSPNTQEIFDLKGKNYNAYWGWQDGEKRSERIRKFFQPMFILSHNWEMGEKTTLSTNVSYQFGKDGRSRLDWFNAPNPSPIYYRNLPSWYVEIGATPETLETLYDRWENDSDWYQINWEGLYAANANIPTETHGDVTGKRAAYYLVYDYEDDKIWNVNTQLHTEIMPNWKFNLNVNYQNFRSDVYREVDDLLGADFALNLDDFNNYVGFGPNLTIQEGEKIEYFYKLNRQSVTINPSSQWVLDNWNIAVSVLLGYSESYRDGQWRNGLYPNNSYGKSEKVVFNDIGFKTGLQYKIDGRNFIVGNMAYYTQAPTLDEIFSNGRQNNLVTPNITNQKINSSDLSFIHRSPNLKARVTGYYTTVKDGTDITRYYAQGLALTTNTGQGVQSADAFVAEILSDIDKQFWGGELGIEYKITSALTFSAAASVGEYTYADNPTLFLNVDDADSQGIFDFGESYLKDYKLEGPQHAYNAGLRYFSPDFWWIGVSANYLGNSYLAPSPILRTQNFVTNPNTGNPYPGATDESVRALLKQQQFSNEYMFNASIGKSFRFGKYTLGLSAMVNNLLDNRDYITGGFEQGRAANYPDFLEDSQRELPIFGPRFWVDRGRSYFINVYLRF